MKLCISFKKFELELFNYATKHRSVSAYIKDLIEADMKENMKVNKEKGEDNSNYDNSNYIW